MGKDSGKGPTEQALFAGEAWFDPIEAGLRDRIRGLVEGLVEQELEAALGVSVSARTRVDVVNWRSRAMVRWLPAGISAADWRPPQHRACGFAAVLAWRLERLHVGFRARDAGGRAAENRGVGSVGPSMGRGGAGV